MSIANQAEAAGLTKHVPNKKDRRTQYIAEEEDFTPLKDSSL